MIGQIISHYRILEKLGQGGMGIVYKAEDTKLKRDVAMKLLPRQIALDRDKRERFVIEAQAAAALNHANIATIYSIEEVDDEVFIVMEYVDGKELGREIESGVLKLDDALDLAIQVAEGLQEAHENGIVHRDIKSANIMVTKKGQAKVMDFGLAKIAGSTTVTQAGTTLGTAAYMSPEQARGEDVDYRTDIWSLGVVLYEMITGQVSFKGEYEQAVIYSILNEDPAPMVELRRGVPGELEWIVRKCLAKNPAERYQHMDDLLVDLRLAQQRLEMGILEKRLAKVVSPFRYRIAVLPFASISPNPEDEYFADGMTEELISTLSKISELRVIARTSVMQYKHIAKSIAEIGRELKVGNVLEGSIREAADKLRITVQLIDSESQEPLWSQDYDREFKDVFAIQSDIANRVADALRVQLIQREKEHIKKKGTESIDAYRLYLRGRYYWNKRTEEGLRKCIECLEKSIEQYPEYALAYAGLADAYIILGDYGYLSPKEAYPRAEEAATKALEIDDALAEAHTSLGCVKSLYDWDWIEAENEFEYAIALNPKYATTYHWYAINFLTPNSRFDEAISEIKRAVEIDPLSLIINTTVGLVFYYARHHDQAIEQYQKTLEMDPDFGVAHFFLAWAYEQKGMFEEAIASLEKGDTFSGSSTAILAELGCTYAFSGKKSEAMKILEKLTKGSEAKKISPYSLYSIAGIYAGLGEEDQALDWLQKAYLERSYRLIYIQVDPRLDCLRSDPRFKELLKKVGLER